MGDMGQAESDPAFSATSSSPNKQEWRNGDAGNWNDAIRGERGAWHSRSCTNGVGKTLRNCTSRSCQSQVTGSCFQTRASNFKQDDLIVKDCNPFVEKPGWVSWDNIAGFWQSNP